MPKTFVIPKQTLPYIAGRKLHAMKIRDGFENKPWANYLVYLANKGEIAIRPTSQTIIEQGTAETLLPIWEENFSVNLPYIKNGDSTVVQHATGDEGHTIAEIATSEVKGNPEHSAIVVGRGPSIFKHKHLEILADAKKNGTYTGLIVATDGMLLECLQRNILPDLTVSVDGSPIIKQWYDNVLVKKYGDKLKIALPATINNSVYKTCVTNGCHVYWYIPMLDAYLYNESLTRIMRALTKTPNNPNGLTMCSLGGNAGSAAWVMSSQVLKCAPVCLIGIDFGYPEGTKLADTCYYSTMIQNSIQVQEMYGEIYHPFFKTKAYIDRVFDHYRQAFRDLQSQSPPWFQPAGGTINCTEGGTLWGHGIKCMRFADFLSKYHK